MADREQTLVAILTSLDALKTGGAADAGLGIKAAHRNRVTPIQPAELPALILEDGPDTGPVVVRERNGRTAGAGVMSLEFTVWLGLTAKEAVIGSSANTIAAAVIARLATDPDLTTALADHDKITFEKTEVLLEHAEAGAMMQLGLVFSVNTILNPSNP